MALILSSTLNSSPILSYYPMSSKSSTHTGISQNETCNSWFVTVLLHYHHWYLNANIVLAMVHRKIVCQMTIFGGRSVTWIGMFYTQLQRDKEREEKQKALADLGHRYSVSKGLIHVSTKRQEPLYMKDMATNSKGTRITQHPRAFRGKHEKGESVWGIASSRESYANELESSLCWGCVCHNSLNMSKKEPRLYFFYILWLHYFLSPVQEIHSASYQYHPMTNLVSAGAQ